MKYLGPVAAVCGALTVAFSLSACKSIQVSAESALSQAEAEKLVSVTTINGCNGDRSQLQRAVKLGTPDPNGHIREKYGPVMVYPVQVTWTGSCVGGDSNRTDFFENINAKYTTSFWRNDFGEWSNTPYNGLCKWQRVAYQIKGQPKTPIPNPSTDGCALMDLRNQ